MKKFFNTFAVFLGNLLSLRLTAWKECEKTAAEMQAAFEAFKPGVVEIDGVEQAVKAPDTPFVFLGNQILNALAFVAGVWIVYKIVVGFLVLLPYLFVFGLLVMVALAFFGNKKVSVPATAS
jgi:hypothetical protein